MSALECRMLRIRLDAAQTAPQAKPRVMPYAPPKWGRKKETLWTSCENSLCLLRIACLPENEGKAEDIRIRPG